MKAIRILSLAAILSLGFYGMGCETSHTETDKQNLLGGETHEETTTTHNPVTGTDDVSKSETVTH